MQKTGCVESILIESITERLNKSRNHTQKIFPGAGIPKDRTLSVFEAFVQADESTTRLHGGTGLGLTIVKSFIELIGGTITIEEKATPGTLFRVRLFFRGEEAVSV